MSKRSIKNQGQKEEGTICFKERCGNTDLQFFYFIGRMNPPTIGHIESLSRLISSARENGTKAIILIGSGPQDGVLSLDDPITIELKMAFLNMKLSNLGFNPGEYVFIPKDNVHFTNQIYENIMKQIEVKEQMTGVQINSVGITQVAGDKDDDLMKLKWVRDGLEERFSEKYSTCKSDVLPIRAVQNQGSPMSATSVRKKAYTSYLQSGKNLEKAFNLFDQTYHSFYEDFTPEIFRQVMNPLVDMSPRRIQMPISDEVLQQYIRGVANKKTGELADLNAKFYVCKKDKQTRGGHRRRRGRKSRRTRKIKRRRTMKKRRN